MFTDSDSPEGDTLKAIEVSPSGLFDVRCHLTHGSRRGLPSVALRAEIASDAHDQSGSVDFEIGSMQGATRIAPFVDSDL